MVATRRGVRASPPRKSDSEPLSDAQATPSSSRRTRSAAKTPAQRIVEEASSHLQILSEDTTNSTRKRCTRASRLHSPEMPCTPVSSVHEGDISDLESCCSAVSDIEPATTRRSTRRVRRNKQDEVSEVESSSSVVSASKVRSSSRKKPIQAVSDSASDVKEDKTDHDEPCAVPQRNKRTTRHQLEDSEASDADSVSKSKPVSRRSARTRRKTNIDETLDRSQSPAPTQRRTRATKSKAETTTDVIMSCDSESLESGPSYSRTTRGRRTSQLKITDSESELTDVGLVTPSSSRTGSGSSNRAEKAAAAKFSKCLGLVLEKVIAPSDQEESMDDSRLESTVLEKDADSTLIEENKDKEDILDETKQEIKTFTDEKSEFHNESLPNFEKTAEEPAVTTEKHQEEPSAESLVEEAPEMEMMQETNLASSEAETATVTRAPQSTDRRNEDMEVASADTDVRDEKDDDKQDMEEKDVAMTEGDQAQSGQLNEEAKEVVESIQEFERAEEEQDKKEPVQATSSQQHQAAPQPAVAQSKTAVSLLDSSDDEDDDEGEDFADEIPASSEEEKEDKESEEGAGQSRKTEVSKSIEGLFMIDTRPGQEVDEQYVREELKEARAEQEEEDDEEEFVDEEGESDDEAATVLFSSRNSQVKELSSRIDPGIRMKELGGLYISFDGSKSKPVSSSQLKTKEKKIQDEVMKKSVIGPDFEKKEAVPPYKESKHALKQKHRAERSKTTGDAWFNMKAPEITPELKGDLQLLRMRGSMDSKRFYKKNDRDGFPKYFQMGTVVDNPVDFYHSRVSKKDRKRTMVEELLADAEFRQQNKKKFQSIMAEKAALAAGRRHKKKNKFHNKK